MHISQGLTEEILYYTMFRQAGSSSLVSVRKIRKEGGKKHNIHLSSIACNHRQVAPANDLLCFESM